MDFVTPTIGGKFYGWESALQAKHIWEVGENYSQNVSLCLQPTPYSTFFPINFYQTNFHSQLPYIYVQKVALLARAIFSESFLLVSTRKRSLHNPLKPTFLPQMFSGFFVCIYICKYAVVYIWIYISKRGFHIPENVSVFVCVFDQLRVRKSIYTSIYLFFLTLLVFYMCTVYTHDMVFCLL